MQSLECLTTILRKLYWSYNKFRATEQHQTWPIQMQPRLSGERLTRRADGTPTLSSSCWFIGLHLPGWLFDWNLIALWCIVYESLLSRCITILAEVHESQIFTFRAVLILCIMYTNKSVRPFKKADQLYRLPPIISISIYSSLSFKQPLTCTTWLGWSFLSQIWSGFYVLHPIVYLCWLSHRSQSPGSQSSAYMKPIWSL